MSLFTNMIQSIPIWFMRTILSPFTMKSLSPKRSLFTTKSLSATKRLYATKSQSAMKKLSAMLSLNTSSSQRSKQESLSGQQRALA